MLKLRESITKHVERFDKEIANEPDEKIALEVMRMKDRWLSRNDLFYLGRLTGHSLLLDPFHKEICDDVSLMNWQLVRFNVFPKHPDMLTIDEVTDSPEEDLAKLQSLYEVFRSGFKTTISDIIHVVQLLLCFPNIHIAICSNTQVNASDTLVAARDLFRTTHLKVLFPEWIQDDNKWGNKLGFSVGVRTNYSLKGDNVEAIGINTRVTGRKYHVFKNTDIVDEFSITNDEQLRQSRDYIDRHKNLFVMPVLPIEHYDGTRYHYADAYVKLEENPQVKVFKRTLLVPDALGDIIWQGTPHRCVISELFNKPNLPKQLKIGIQGLMENEYEFNSQQMLNPQDPKKIKFTKEMIQSYLFVPDGLNCYLLVDPADSLEKRACYTAMEVWGVDHDENWFWLDALFDKIDDRQRIDEAIRLAKKWRVFEVLWENLSFGRTDERNFERASRLVPDSQRTWMVRAIGAMKVSKDDRILGLNDRYSRRKVFWPQRLMYYSQFEGKNIDIVEKMEYEFLNFPLVSHKDLLDAQSFLLQIDLIKGDRAKSPEVSKYAHIKDPVQRGNTEVFWRDFDAMKEKEFGKVGVVEFEEI